MKTMECKTRIARRLRLAAMLGTALTAPFAITPALAQSADEASVDSNTIIVTAQRRSEALEDVPMSISVVPQQTLSNLGVNSVRDLANVTSGFQVNNAGSYPQPAIRGVTTVNAGSYENNVALFIDGLYQTTPQVLNMDLPNVDSIQVLKGPQGTLYGRNATGGAILIDTKDPTEDWHGNLEATYGRFNDRRARGYFAGPLSDRVGISVAGTVRYTDGYYKKASRTTPGAFEENNFLGLKQGAIRAKLKVALTDTFTATLGYNYLRASDPRGVIFTGIENVNTPYTTPGRTTRPRGLGEVAGDVWDLDINQHEGSLKLEWDTGIGTLRSVSGWTRARYATVFDSGGTYVPDNYSSSKIEDRTWQENLDYNINVIDKVDLLVGGNYYNIKTNYLPGFGNSFFLAPTVVPDPAVAVTPLSSYLRSSDTYFFRTKEAWAVFGNATFHATDQLSITVGGRYSKETQDVSGYKVNFSTVTGLATSCPYSINGETHSGLTCTRPSAKTSHYSKFTPSASIRFEISPRTNIYASYSKGFRGGEWNSVIPSDDPRLWFDAKQESIDAYEIGIKSAGSRFHAELAGFLYNYKDLQVSSTTFVGGVALVTLQNSPSAKIYGAEANFDFSITDNFQIRAGATYLHARYGDNFIFVGTGVNPNGVGYNVSSDPLKVAPNVSSVNQNLSGLQMARAPDFTGFVGFDYNIPKGEGGLRLAANLKYTTSYVVTNPSVWGGETAASFNAKRALNPNYLPDNTAILAGTPYVNRASQERARQNAYALVNASITWTDPTGHQYIRVWGNNLTNVRYKTHYSPGTTTYAPIGEPLTYGGTIGYKF